MLEFVTIVDLVISFLLHKTYTPIFRRRKCLLLKDILLALLLSGSELFGNRSDGLAIRSGGQSTPGHGRMAMATLK